jgi:rubrerythrin
MGFCCLGLEFWVCLEFGVRYCDLIKGGKKMSYSSEEMGDEELAVHDDLDMLREDLVGELQAINQYQVHILSLENEEAATALEHIIEEEKEHVAELLRLIRNLDPVQADKFKEIL